MTVIAPRHADIHNRFRHHFFVEVGNVGIAAHEPAVWWREHQTVDFGELAILGWAWPIANAGYDGTNAATIIPFSPQVIDEQTDTMDQARFDTYMVLIMWVLDRHLGLWWDIEDDVARHRRIMEELAVPESGLSYMLLQEMFAAASLRYL